MKRKQGSSTGNNPKRTRSADSAASDDDDACGLFLSQLSDGDVQESDEEGCGQFALQLTQAALSSRTEKSQPVNEDTAESVRKIYLRAMESGSVDTFGQRVIEKFLREEDGVSLDTTPRTVLVHAQPGSLRNGHTYQECECTGMLTIGASGRADVTLTERTISRLHCIVVWVRNVRDEVMTIIIDMWSLHGTRISNSPHISSTGSRALLSLPGFTPLSLTLGSKGQVSITVDARACVACLDRPRTQIFSPCQHLACCETCALAIVQVDAPKCPICRTPITAQHVSRSHLGEVLTQCKPPLVVAAQSLERSWDCVENGSRYKVKGVLGDINGGEARNPSLRDVEEGVGECEWQATETDDNVCVVTKSNDDRGAAVAQS